MSRKFIVALPLLLCAPAMAEEGNAAGCAATAAIVADAVSMRADGTSQEAAAKGLQSGNVAEKYKDAVAPLVGWVYTLPQDQLTDEAASAYHDACLAQLG
ncbi:hypothetical protein ACEWPM_015870 [Roseovarius sp. S4756]|uniref:hypothetical protein n=1 Tax=Roseovarius maritimus TaxID=3342637 RepID=UPI0037295576